MAASQTLVSKHPLLGCVACFACGIAAAHATDITFRSDILVVVTLVAATFLFLLAALSKRIEGFGLAFTLLAPIVLSLAGFTSYSSQQERTAVELPNKRIRLRGVVVEPPRVRDRSATLMLALSLDSTNGAMAGHRMQLNIGIRDSIHARSIPGVGHSLEFVTSPDYPRTLGNPDEYDYAAWLKRQGVVATGHAFADDWQESKTVADIPKWESVKLHFMKLRKRLTDQYAVHIKGDALAIAMGLTLGDKSMITPELRSSFSDSGASHVLALSGLHIAIIYSLLIAVFSLGRRTLQAERIGSLVCVGFMWLFAMLAGMPTSLLRSVIMYTMLSLSMLMGGARASLSNLAFAALCILVASPSSLFDVGSQLSFTAVFFILYAYPLTRRIRLPRHAALRYVPELILVSLCAQIGVAGIVAMHFHSFPTYFLFANLVVIPAAFVIIALSLLFFVLPISAVQALVGQSLSLVIDGMTTSLSWLASLPYASLSLFPSSLTVALLYSLLLLGTTFMWQRRRWQFACSCLLGTACLASAFADHYHRTHMPPTLAIYHTPGVAVVHMISTPDDHTAWTSNERAWSRAETNVRSYLQRWGISKPPRAAVVDSDGLIVWRNKRIAIFTAGRNAGRGDYGMGQTDIVVITHGANAEIERIAEICRPQTIVLASDLHPYERRLYAVSAQALGVNFHDVQVAGAFVIETN